ncbi:ABC transporter ATP-binding protein [bacterium]|nr:ABC transporter ATP-binding protein [bacterium]
MLRVEGLSKNLGEFDLSDVSFEAREGEYLVLLGASGVGKSVLLETIAGICMPDTGRVLLGGIDITFEKIQKRDIGIVFQNGALFPHLTVEENVSYGLRCRGEKGKGIRKKVDELAEQFGFSSIMGRNIATLSGGETQRVALARALAIRPRCLLLDEPLSSLDRGARSEIRSLLRRLKRRGIIIIHVTHDYEEALSLADRVGVMEEGTVVQIDNPEKIFTRPISGFVADFVGIRNFFHGRLVAEPADKGGVSEFISNGNGIRFSVLTDKKDGEGNIIIRSEDITLSTKPVSSSARNTFKGKVVDIFPARIGMEVIVDVGDELAALVTRGSVERLGLEQGKDIFVSVKASAVRFIGV